MSDNKKSVTILVIDDSSTICKSAELFLSKAGHIVKTAEDGFDAISKISKVNPDLIFIDVLMPRIDGLQTCRLIRANEAYSKVPIIFLSSKDGEFDKAKGMMVGANDYLTKPFSRTEILDAVEKYFPKNED